MRIRYNHTKRRSFMRKKNQVIALILLTMVFLVSCRSSNENAEVLLAPIKRFTSDVEENIKFVRTKEYDGRTVREYTDSKFYYEVTNEGRLLTIFLRNEPTNTTPIVATKEEILLKSSDNLRRLNYDLSQFQTDIKYDETLKQYKSTSRETSGEAYTGNNVYIQYASDGTLISISFKYENPEVLNTPDKITPDEAKDIIINYFSTNASTERYADLLTKDAIRHEVDVYNNKKVYNLYFTVPTDEHGNFDFMYVLSTETGIILYRKEI